MTWALVFEQLLNGLQYGVTLFLMAAGLTLVFGIMNMVNLAHGSLYMMGAYFAAAGLDGAPEFVAWQASAITGLSALVASEPLAAWKALLTYHAIERRAAVRPRPSCGSSHNRMELMAEVAACVRACAASTPMLFANCTQPISGLPRSSMFMAVGPGLAPTFEYSPIRI